MDIMGLLPTLLEEFQNISPSVFDGTFEDFLSLKGFTSNEIELLSSHVDEEGDII